MWIGPVELKLQTTELLLVASTTLNYYANKAAKKSLYMTLEITERSLLKFLVDQKYPYIHIPCTMHLILKIVLRQNFQWLM